MADRMKKRYAAKKPAAGKRVTAKRPSPAESPKAGFRPRGFLGLAWIQFRAVRWPSV